MKNRFCILHKKAGLKVSAAIAALLLLMGSFAGCTGINEITTFNEPVEEEIIPETAIVECEAVEGLRDDFIFGADLSSYEAQIESDVKYYDFDGNVLDDAGFFEMLHGGGVNYVRIRLWNDPSDAEGHSYGGGHCDIETAKHIGKLATDAGMRVMIDYHYSDFWAEATKQTAPKAWQDMSVEKKIKALSDYTKSTLQVLLDAGVDVGIVQVGNETNAGVAGVSSWPDICRLLGAGCDAVHEVASEKDIEILTAVHFTDPQTPGRYESAAELLEKNGVDYDIFASSWYPYRHGSLEDLGTILKSISEKYAKRVMISETSYVQTLNDKDGTENNESTSSFADAFPYDISAQGQIDEMRDVVNMMSGIGHDAIGVCYFEPAWIPVGVVDPDSSDALRVFESNQSVWKEHGSGWASEYAAEYDEYAKKWFGGSVVDNEAWFDPTGHPLPSVNTFRYIKNGVSLWDASARMDCEEPPSEISDEEKNALPDGAVNLLKSPGFEEDDVWEIVNVRGEAGRIEEDPNNVRSGDRCLKFWDDVDFEFFAKQEVTLDAGTYCLGGYFEGDDCGDGPSLEIYLKDPNSVVYMAETSAMGWQKWDNPEIRDIVIEEDGTTVNVHVYVQAFKGGWGAWDDVYLYRLDAPATDDDAEDTDDGEGTQETEE